LSAGWSAARNAPRSAPTLPVPVRIEIYLILLQLDWNNSVIPHAQSVRGYTVLVVIINIVYNRNKFWHNAGYGSNNAVGLRKLENICLLLLLFLSKAWFA
jgi:hypothetical protein